MGFGFRKSFSSGPFRFTVSRGGVSSSFGVRGARITAGPRGTFVTISSHGAYYRHRIDSPKPRQSAPEVPHQAPEPPQLDTVFQVPISELVESNQNELVQKLNQNVAATNPTFIPIVASVLAFFTLPNYPVIGTILVCVGIALAITIYRRFKASHTHEVHYSLDEGASKRFATVYSAISQLSSCNRVWVLNTSSRTADFKHNAGASTLITRKAARIGALPTKGFKASVGVWSIEANEVVFHFLPDQILVFSGNRYASLQYGQLSVDVRSTRYIETDSVPGDSRQIDTTWRFVNKNGGPDRRFNNNHQIPVLQYGEVTLRAGNGFQVILQTSNLEKAQAFVTQFQTQSNSQDPVSDSSQRNESRPATVDQSVLACYTLLGLTRPATAEQAAAAHRQKAALYHPDKYEHLAPEMKALALAKMAEINAAYTLVKLDIEG
jgi:hypothetical protein